MIIGEVDERKSYFLHLISHFTIKTEMFGKEQPEAPSPYDYTPFPFSG
jgi:hypothetical protein